MTDDDETKTPIDHALDVVVYLPLGFVLDFPRSIPRYIARGRSQLDPGRLLSRGGSSSPFDPVASLGRIQAQTRSTLRALGVGPRDATGDGRSSVSGPGANGSGGRPTTPAPSAPAPAAASAPVEPVPPGGASGIHPDSLAITDYDSLSASQVVPRLDSLAGEELENIRQYEAATRGRKTILNKIALLQSS